MLYPRYDPADLPDEQRHANLNTVRRARLAVAFLVESQRQRRQAEGLIHSWGLDREALDKAAASLAIPPMSDEEWQAIEETRPKAPDPESVTQEPAGD